MSLHRKTNTAPFLLYVNPKDLDTQRQSTQEVGKQEDVGQRAQALLV
jgi:hypothetical protein